MRLNVSPVKGFPRKVSSASVARKGIAAAWADSNMNIFYNILFTFNPYRTIQNRKGHALRTHDALEAGSLSFFGLGKIKANDEFFTFLSADLPGPRKSEVKGMRRVPETAAISTCASRAVKVMVPSAAGSACAALPPRVATLRTWGPPIRLQASTSAWACVPTKGSRCNAVGWDSSANEEFIPPQFEHVHLRDKS